MGRTMWRKSQQAPIFLRPLRVGYQNPPRIVINKKLLKQNISKYVFVKYYRRRLPIDHPNTHTNTHTHQLQHTPTHTQTTKFHALNPPVLWL